MRQRSARVGHCQATKDDRSIPHRQGHVTGIDAVFLVTEVKVSPCAQVVKARCGGH